MSVPVGCRIVVVGTTGAGKTTLARQLSARLRLPHVELDALFWGPKWTPIAPETFRQRVTEALQSKRWVSDGNYSKARDIVWSQADTVIWLDYPLVLIFWRLLVRGIRRIATREMLWGINHETIFGTFFARDTLFSWAVKTHYRRRREYPQIFHQSAFVHLNVFRFTAPRRTKKWIDKIHQIQ